MSGFDVAGIILGVFPLAITALEKYREVAVRLGLFNKIKLEYRKCSNELELQQLIFTRHLKQLLLPLVADNGKVQELINNPAGEAWKDASIVELLRTRLKDSYELYIEYMKGMEHVMDKLQKELAVDADFVQSKLADSSKRPATRARVKSVLSRDDLLFQLYRLKFSNGESVRTKLFAELQAYNNKLEKLLDSSDKVTVIEQQRASKKQASAIDGAICNFWVQATKLFKALAAAWKCHCGDQHCAKLLLQHRVDKAVEVELLFMKTLPSYWEVTKARVAKGDYVAAKSTLIKETVTLVDKLPLRQANHRSHHPTKSAMKSKASTTTVQLLRPPPSITITAVQVDQHTHQPIFNLCKDLNQPDGSCCGYLPMDEEDYRYFVYNLSSQRRSSVTSITLEHILRGDVSPAPTRRQRYAISLVLASSFLQLIETPWLTSSFRKEDITFFSDPSNANVFLLDQPHIARVFTTTSTDGASLPLTNSLDQFGILLLELCFGKRLADHPLRKQWPEGRDKTEQTVFDVMAARDWQCSVIEEAGSDYSEAIAWCLGGNRSTPSEAWRQEMLKRVVLPLQRCQEYFVSGRV